MQFRAFRMRLKKDRINEYIEVHKKEKIWDSLIEGMKKSGFRKMILLQHGQDIIALNG